MTYRDLLNELSEKEKRKFDNLRKTEVELIKSEGFFDINLLNNYKKAYNELLLTHNEYSGIVLMIERNKINLDAIIESTTDL